MPVRNALRGVIPAFTDEGSDSTRHILSYRVRVRCTGNISVCVQHQIPRGLIEKHGFLHGYSRIWAIKNPAVARFIYGMWVNDSSLTLGKRMKK